MQRIVSISAMAWMGALLLAGCASQAAAVVQLTPESAPLVSQYPGQGSSLAVFAAASLKDAFQEMVRDFEATYPGLQVELNLAGSQQLALQIEQGARADVFASADQRNMDRVISAGLVESGAPLVFARNQMVVILPADNPGEIVDLRDLTRPGLKLVFAADQVPAGVYARHVLENLAADPAYGLGFADAVLHNLRSNEENVKQVVAKVQLGEADVGIVYRSDVTPALSGKLKQIPIPDQFNVAAAYPIAVLKAAPHARVAGQFVEFVLSPHGQRILAKWGLTPVTE